MRQGLPSRQVISSNDNWQVSTKPCLAQTTIGVFNLGTVINRVHVVQGGDSDDVLFEGGCAYTNTANTKTFLASSYKELSFNRGVQEILVSDSTPATEDVWRIALFAGQKPSTTNADRYYVCGVREGRHIYYGRAVKGGTDCFYSRAMTYPDDGSGLYADSRKNFSVLPVHSCHTRNR